MLDNLTSLKICKGEAIMNHEGLSKRRRVAQIDLVISTDENTDLKLKLVCYLLDDHIILNISHTHTHTQTHYTPKQQIGI